MDVNKLNTGEKVAAGSAILLFIVMFFNWFGIGQDDAVDLSQDNLEDLANKVPSDFTGDRVDFNAWQSFSFIDIVLFVAIIVAVGLAVMAATSRSANLPVAASAVTAGLGILATVLVLFRLIVTPYDLGRDFFAFVGLILAAGIAVGGWLAMQEEGVSFQGEADRLQGPGGGGAAPPPPPPPNR
jgi:quinol-cytochrome oxidoreductase complex cytochrome b subunit